MQRILSFATPLLMLGGGVAAQAARECGGAGLASSDDAPGRAKTATTMKVWPERTTLVTEVPERVEMLSLNNSLINFQRQDTIWNRMAAKMGKDAAWTTHTILGQPLSYHWMETDESGNNVEGQPSAQSMIRLKPWTHIILQEQTERPRLDFEDFRRSIGRWVEFIRENCPNPHAIVILPVNWALISSLDAYSETINLVIDNYRRVAQEFGVVLAPVSSAYRNCYEREGEEVLKRWYMDDRHPTIESAYLAACIEYAVVYGERPTTISWAPATISPAEAMRIRLYAEEAMDDVEQVVDHHKGTVRMECRRYDEMGQEQDDRVATTWSVDGGGSIDEDGVYTTDGEVGCHTVEARCDALVARASVCVAQPVTRMENLPTVELAGSEAGYAQDFNGMGDGLTLPEGWRADCQSGYGRVLGYFALADDGVMVAQTEENVTLEADAACGSWNFGARGDRAVGGITSERSNSPRVVNVYLHVRNAGETAIDQPTLDYDIEKYRKGKNSAGFDVVLYASRDGVEWSVVGDDFKTHFDADDATEGYESVPGEMVKVGGTLPRRIEPGDDLFLAWSFRVASGHRSGEAMALAIDNVRFNCPPDLDGIKPTTGQEDKADKGVYNLKGQRVASGYRGIVISDRRKFIQK